MQTKMFSRIRSLRFPLRGVLVAVFVFCLFAGIAAPADSPEIFPVDQVKPGMKGVAYTIFAGDQIEKFDLVVLGVLPDLIGPRQPIVLVQLVGAKVEHTGVVAGMSGSPVFIDGKLLGALSLKFGQFTKEPLGGVTPIQNMMEVGPPAGASSSFSVENVLPEEQAQNSPPRYSIPEEVVARSVWPKTDSTFMNGGAFLTPIETPLFVSGISPRVLAQFAPQFASFGLVATSGGSGTPQPDDANIVPGDMVTVVLASGDTSLGASCTVTAIIAGRVYACGHPIFGFGNVQYPLARGRVVATLSSDLDSTKIVTTGGIIGTLSQDRITAVMGTLGAGPKMIPMDMTLVTQSGTREFRFKLANDAKLTPLLVGLEAMNGLTANTAYSDGTTLRISGDIQISGHSPVQLDNMFAPVDSPAPDGAVVAATVQNLFSRVYTNPYEKPEIDHIRLKLESLPERRVTTIDGAWSDSPEAAPGQTIQVKVLLRPYRGPSELRTIPVTIPQQADRGTTMRLLVSDSLNADRTTRPISPFAITNQAGGLEQLIHVLNRERRNNRLYVTLLQPTTTLLLEDKELPNAPLSTVNVLDQRRGAPITTALRESLAGEWSLPTEGIVSGSVSIAIRIK
ncbi:MAG TPA: hypothetical protein VLV89_02280 [Candidatus Acidoferrum sp.]|nr:hypothetical protein [Candidatus Acidoferrum sp.]